MNGGIKRMPMRTKLIKAVLAMLFVALFNAMPLCANDTIQINENQYFIDIGHKLVLTNMHVSWINATWTNSKSHISLSEICTFSSPIGNVEVGNAYEIFVPSQNAFFTLFFTEMPIVGITTPHVVGQTEVFAQFKLVE